MVAITRSGILFPIVLAAMILLPSLAQAQDDDARDSKQTADPSRPETVYFSLHGGWSLMHDSQFSRFSTFYTVEPDAEAAFDSGKTGGIAIGYRSDRPWRVEFEVAHRSNTFDYIQWNRYWKFGGYPTSGKVETVSYLVNFIGEMQSDEGYRLFAGIGVGAAHFKLKNVSDEDGALFSDNDTSLAGQFLIGVEYAMTERVAFSLSYKLFGSTLTTHADPGQPEIGGDRVRMPVASSSILLGLAYYF